MTTKVKSLFQLTGIRTKGGWRGILRSMCGTGGRYFRGECEVPGGVAACWYVRFSSWKAMDRFQADVLEEFGIEAVFCSGSEESGYLLRLPPEVR